MNENLIFPRKNDKSTCLLKSIIKDENIVAGKYSYYHDFDDPLNFEKKNVLYHYGINNDKLIIGNFCSIASGAKFLFNGGNHKAASYVNYPFSIFPDQWDKNLKVTDSWDNKGDIVVGNDVWIGFEALIMTGVTIGDGAIIGSRSIVTKDVKPYEIVAGSPAKVIRKRFDDETIELLLQLQWWNMEDERIKEILPVLMNCKKDELKALLK